MMQEVQHAALLLHNILLTVVSRLIYCGMSVPHPPRAMETLISGPRTTGIPPPLA